MFDQENLIRKIISNKSLSLKLAKSSLNYLLIFIIVVSFFLYLFVEKNSILLSKTILRINENPINAFILTENCRSARFNFTKENLERVFPNFLHIYCIKTISINDSRIHPSSSLVFKKNSLILISHVNLWSFQITKYAQNLSNNHEWSFVFEDDVDFINPNRFSLTSYIEPTKELMNNQQIQYEDGLFYFGICAPTLDNHSQIIIHENTNKTLMSFKGYGWCTHAMALTTKRAQSLWTQISLFRSTHEEGIDKYIIDFCNRSRTTYYVLGSNIHWLRETDHYGIAFQDRQKFVSIRNPLTNITF